MQVKKVYPKAKGWVKERFIQLFGGEIPHDAPNLMFSDDNYAAITLKEVDTAKDKWFRELRTFFEWATYLGKLTSIQDSLDKYDFVVYEDLHYSAKHVKNALTVIKLDLHDDVDVWILRSTFKGNIALGLGSKHGFIFIYPNLNLEGKGIGLFELIEKSKAAASFLIIPNKVIEEWCEEFDLKSMV